MQRLFNNYELEKIDIFAPELTNIVIFILFFLITGLTVRKRDNPSPDLMSIRHTDQLKGFAIACVIIGHLWVHVAAIKPSIVLSENAVSIFLLLSGFGLTKANEGKTLRLKVFLYRRIKRVMIPYWVVTILILILDYIILNRILDAESIIMTLLGLNFSVKLRYVDYVRWFVTFILLWYIIFFIFQKYFASRKKILLMLLFAVILLPLNYYILNFGWYNFFSFPVGCALATYYPKINGVWKKNRNSVICFSTSAIFCVLFYKIIENNEKIWNIITTQVPNILIAFFNDGLMVLFSLGILVVFGYLDFRGIESKILLFLGKYSYEIFLLHGAFLVKYNPFIKAQNNITLISSFSAFILFIVTLSFSLSKLTRMVYVKKES